MCLQPLDVFLSAADIVKRSSSLWSLQSHSRCTFQAPSSFTNILCQFNAIQYREYALQPAASILDQPVRSQAQQIRKSVLLMLEIVMNIIAKEVPGIYPNPKLQTPVISTKSIQRVYSASPSTSTNRERFAIFVARVVSGLLPNNSKMGTVLPISALIQFLISTLTKESTP
jgi:hypothetical protein